MHIFWPCPDPLNHKPSRWFWCTQNFENHQVRPRRNKHTVNLSYYYHAVSVRLLFSKAVYTTVYLFLWKHLFLTCPGFRTLLAFSQAQSDSPRLRLLPHPSSFLALGTPHHPLPAPRSPSFLRETCADLEAGEVLSLLSQNIWQCEKGHMPWCQKPQGRCNGFL